MTTPWHVFLDTEYCPSTPSGRPKLVSARLSIWVDDSSAWMFRIPKKLKVSPVDIAENLVHLFGGDPTEKEVSSCTQEADHMSTHSCGSHNAISSAWVAEIPDDVANDEDSQLCKLVIELIDTFDDSDVCMMTFYRKVCELIGRKSGSLVSKS